MSHLAMHNKLNHSHLSTCYHHLYKYAGFKVAVNRKLQKFMRGLSILVLYIEVPRVSFAMLYCRASLVLLSQQIS